MLKYLANYVSGVAIHDGRMISDDGERVTFMAKNYRRKTRGPVPVSGEEFVRRFSTHILPLRFRRVRYSGLLAPPHRKKKLALCRTLLPTPEPANTPDEQGESAHCKEGQEERDQEEKAEKRCPCCGAVLLIWLGKLTAAEIAATKQRQLEHGEVIDRVDPQQCSDSSDSEQVTSIPHVPLPEW